MQLGLDWNFRICSLASPLGISPLPTKIKTTALNKRNLQQQNSVWCVPLWTWGAGVTVTGKGHEAGNVHAGGDSFIKR